MGLEEKGFFHFYLFTCTCIFLWCVSFVLKVQYMCIGKKVIDINFALLYSPQSQNHLSWVYLKVIPKYSKCFLFQKVNLNCSLID